MLTLMLISRIPFIENTCFWTRIHAIYLVSHRLSASFIPQEATQFFIELPFRRLPPATRFLVPPLTWKTPHDTSDLTVLCNGATRAPLPMNQFYTLILSGLAPVRSLYYVLFPGARTKAKLPSVRKSQRSLRAVWVVSRSPGLNLKTHNPTNSSQSWKD